MTAEMSTHTIITTCRAIQKRGIYRRSAAAASSMPAPYALS